MSSTLEKPVRYMDADWPLEQLVPPVSCLQRARIALEGSGQVFCANMMREIENEVQRLAYLLELDPDGRDAPKIIRKAYDAIKDGV